MTRPLACLALCLTACGDPCKDLAERICKCDPAVAQQRACVERVDALAGQLPPRSHATDRAERARCSGWLDTCSCRALANGQADQCGLTSP